MNACNRFFATALLATGLLLPDLGIAADSDSPFMSGMRQMMNLFGQMYRNSDSASALSSNPMSPRTMSPWSLNTTPYGMGQPYSWNQYAPWGQSMPWGQPMPWGQQSPHGPTSPWTQSHPNGPWPPGFAGGDREDRALEGTWLGSNGAVLAVKNGLARLYVSEYEYEDFFVQTTAREVRLRSARDDQLSTYEYAVQGDRLALRNAQGVALAFRRFTASPDRW